MADYHEEDQLSWDPTLDGMETNPLLRVDDSLYCRSLESPNNFCISRKQLEMLTHQMDETSRFMKTLLSKPNEPISTKLSPVSRGWSAIKRICNNLLIITLIIQALVLAVLTLLDVLPNINKNDKGVISASSAFMVAFQTLNLLLIIATSVKLSAQWLLGNINNTFLAQNYFATLFLFAGIYTATYRLDAQSWKFVSEELRKDPILVIELYMRMLYLSVSTATLCGSCTISPKEWYNYLFMSIEMLLSFVYFASILSQSIGTANSVQNPSNFNEARHGLISGQDSSREGHSQSNMNSRMSVNSCNYGATHASN